jgi:alkanesulfonate monooxygenase SsuD/methylene tetrahydromethanopterin reductase-like flavin-dependent oxidoreductase (luciferase family)
MTAYAADHRPLDRTADGMTYGVLVPHFGEFASRSRIVDGAVRCERAGFDALWVRDHLLWEPHEMEGSDRTFVEPLAALAAIASRTERIQLGTAVLIPLRWPLKLAQDLASLSYLAGGRLIAGMGLGSGAELPAVGFRKQDRKRIFVETVEILERVWTTHGVDYEGTLFSFTGVDIEPKPSPPIPIWYGGTTPISVANAARHCQGWMPGRIPMGTLEDRLAQIDQLVADGTAAAVTKAVIPIVKVDKSREQARSGLDVRALAGSSEASKTWNVPPGGFETIDDLRGLLCVGDPSELVEQVAEFGKRGIDHFVFDLRLQFEEFEAVVDLIATDVLPVLRAAKV